MTPKEYNETLKRIERENPAEPLLSLLLAGCSNLNLIYMRAALKRLKNIDIQPDRDGGDDDEDQQAASLDPVVKELWSLKGQLFRERAKHSNRFHDCTSDDQRRSISDAILRIWERIQDTDRKINYYLDHGRLPEGEERFPLPDDPAGIMKKLLSIRSLISQEQVKLRKLAELPDDDPQKRTKIEESQARLVELKLYRGHAEQKAQGTAIHAE